MSVSMLVILAVGIVVLVAVSIFATEYIFAPARYGKTVLKRELKKFGVDPARLGEECLDALVAHSATEPREADRNEGRKFWNAFKARLQTAARRIAAVQAGDETLADSDPLYGPLKNAGALQ